MKLTSEEAMQLIATRMKEASNLIEESKEIAENAGLSLTFPHIDGSDYSSDGGWRSSSISC